MGAGPLHPRAAERSERLDHLHRHAPAVVLSQGILQIGTGGEGLIEEVAHGAVLAVVLLGRGAGRGVGAPRFGGGELLQGCWGDLPFAAP